MRHKLSKWPYAELKLTAISVLCYFHLSTTGSKILYFNGSKMKCEEPNILEDQKPKVFKG
jgi:hypothetical protein